MGSLIISDRVVETSTTTGTSAFTLAAAVTGYRRFSAAMAAGDTCYYTIEAIDAQGNPTGEYETGLGTYSSSNTLTRTTVHISSNANAAVSFSAGTKRVFINLTSTQLSLLSPARWTLVDTSGAAITSGATWTFSTNVANVDVTNLDRFDEVMIVLKDVTTASSGSRSVQFSSNNGSTFYSTSGQYIWLPTGAAISNATMFDLTAAATAARSGGIKIPNWRTATVKPCHEMTAIGSNVRMFNVETALNAVRLLCSAGGNITGGTMYVFGH